MKDEETIPDRPLPIAVARGHGHNGNAPSATSKNQLRKEAKAPTRLLWPSKQLGAARAHRPGDPEWSEPKKPPKAKVPRSRRKRYEPTPAQLARRAHVEAVRAFVAQHDARAVRPILLDLLSSPEALDYYEQAHS